MNKPGKISLFKASLLAALLASTCGVQAAGLGKLTVYSAIGQPLEAEVALTATSEELASLSAKLGSYDAFKEAGIEFMPALAGLRFNVARLPDNQAVLKLTTDRPLNEAFLHFLVELNWTAGRMVREYTFLLDPPEMLQAAKPASVVAPIAPQAAPAPQVLPTPVPAAPQPVPAASAPVRPEAPAAKPRPAAPAPVAPKALVAEREVQVKAGDTLSKIARQSKPESVSLDQMLVALFNSNRDVFDGNNMNRLRAGKILRIPDAAEAAQVDAAEARQLIVGQAADFNAYRRRLAAAAQAAPVAEAAPQQQAAGRIEPRIEDKAPPAPARDKLEVSRTEAAKSKGGDKSTLEEELIARDKALREAADRIAALEKNLDNLKKLVELKSQPGAQAQQQAQAVAPKPAEAKQPEPAVKSATEPVKPPEPVAAKPEEGKPAPAVAEKPAEPPPAAAPAPKPVPKAVPQEVPPPPEPSFIAENPELVFGGGGVIALLLGYLGYNAWRRKKQAREESASADKSSPAGDQASTSGALFGAASESVDSSGEVSIQGDFSEGGALTTEESVDPIAEADVYMAYGRDDQAEDILLEGLKTDPTRSAIHLKLMELYANRKSADRFLDVAGRLYDLNDGQGPDWEKAVAMAQAFGIGGGLFAAAATAEAVAAPEAVEEVAVAEPAGEAPPAGEEEAGSLDFDLDLGTTSGPAVAAAEAQPQPAPAEEAMSLDFDFDLGTPEPAAAAAEPEPAVAEPAVADEGNVIDFALDIGSAEAQTPEPEPESVAAAGGNEIDFELDLETGGTPAAEAAPTSESVSDIGGSELPDQLAETPAEPESAPTGALSDLKLDFDLDLGSGPAVAPEAAEPVVDLDLGSINLDLGETELPQEASVEVAAPAEISLPEVELPPPVAETPAAGGLDIDFDLALDTGGQAPPSAEQTHEAGAELPDLDIDLAAPQPGEPEPLASLPDGDLAAEPAAEQEEQVADDPEVATKLELAQAYEEMGDREGARELLNEVLNEGSPAQQALAQARLEQLDV